jgi:hypothetical protein
MLKKPHTKKVSPPSRSAKALTGRQTGLSIRGGHKPKLSEPNNPATTHIDSLTEPPPIPPEIAEHKSARTYWKKYWSYLISRGQAVRDFVPTITTLCILRIQMNRLQISLEALSPLHKMALQGQKVLIQLSRNITALESEHGFTLATHSISQSYNPSQTISDESESTNTLASRKTIDNPYQMKDSPLFEDDDE